MPKQVLLGAISGPAELLDVTGYTGTGNNQNVSTIFPADLLILKNRGTTGGAAYFFDTVRGDSVYLRSDLTNSEVTQSSVSISDTFFSTGSATAFNFIDNGYVAWYFKASGSGASSNSDGSITTTVDANRAAGFSILTYTGNNGLITDTVGHGLNSAPELIIAKPRTTSGDWYVYSSVTGASSRLLLNSGTSSAGSTVWGSTAPTSSVFSVRSFNNTASEDFVAYCFHSVAGISKIGSYTGDGNNPGPVVTTGFEPRFIIIKRTNVSGNWYTFDRYRSPSNPVNDVLEFDTTDPEVESTAYNLDFNSDGFTIKNTTLLNSSGSTYLYLVLA